MSAELPGNTAYAKSDPWLETEFGLGKLNKLQIPGGKLQLWGSLSAVILVTGHSA